MKILIVASGNANYVSAFINDQVDALRKKDVDIDFFLIKGRGVLGYIKNYKSLLYRLKKNKPDLIHAHYGLSGLLSVLQRKFPTVITFHGSDINDPKERYLSRIANRFCTKSIFVSNDLAIKINQISPIVIPCGVDLEIFYPIEKKVARQKLGLSLEKKYILFSSSFKNKVKNYSLAKNSISNINNYNIELLELKGYTRREVALLMNAVDAVIMTSFTEGSPQFIKEAMASNTPIVSVDVGDVKDIIRNTKNCYLVNNNISDISNSIETVLTNGKRTNGRDKIKYMDNKLIAEKVLDVYNSINI